MRVFYILKFMGFCLSQAGGSRKNILNNSKDKVEPSVFWLVQSSRHNFIGPQTSVAYLHSVDIKTPDPVIPIPSSLEALIFSNARNSYVEVPEGANSFAANSSMAILFYLYFEEAYQNATLLQFKGTRGGFELCLQNGVLSATFYSKTGTKYEHSSPEFHLLKPNRWHFVGAEYNKLWADNDQFDLLHIDMSSSHLPRHFSTLTVSGNIPDIDISGCMRLGQNFAEDSSFSGYMSCLQFYTVSVFHPNEILKDLYEKCDPNLWTTDWDSTADFISGSSPFCMSEFTTIQYVTSDIQTTETASTTTQPVTTAKDSNETESTTKQHVTRDKNSTEIDSTTKQPVMTTKHSTEKDSTTAQLVTTAINSTETVSTTAQPVMTTKHSIETVSTTAQPVITTKHSTETVSTTAQPVMTTKHSTETVSTTAQPVMTTKHSTETVSTTVQPVMTTKHSTETVSTTAQPVMTTKHSTETVSTTVQPVMTTEHSQTSSLFTTSYPPLSLSTVSQSLTSSNSSNWSFVTPSSAHMTSELVIESCVRFEKQESNKAVIADMGVYTYGTISECVYRCIRNSLCAAVSYINLNNFIVCSATSDFSNTVFAIGHITYFRK